MGSIELTARQRATLRSARQQRGLTQTALGEKLGMTSQFVNQIESGRRVTSFDNLKIMCEAVGLRITTNVLLEPVQPKRSTKKKRKGQ